MRLGIIGLDSSHVVEFTRILNKEAPFSLGGHRVTAAYPGEVSLDFDMSRDRMEVFTKQITEDFGVQLYSSAAQVVEQVDGILLEQVDARKRLSQFREIVSSRKPVFVDKPFALSGIQCREMLALAKRHGAPVFSSSALRFADGLTRALKRCGENAVYGADFFGPMPFTDTQPGYFWYGVHMVDMLYRVMGTGCERVTAFHTKSHDLVTGVWMDGRIGTIRGSRQGKPSFGGTIYHEAGMEFFDASKDKKGYYECLIEQVTGMLDTGKSPVAAEEMAEVVRFLEAAGESLLAGKFCGAKGFCGQEIKL